MPGQKVPMFRRMRQSLMWDLMRAQKRVIRWMCVLIAAAIAPELMVAQLTVAMVDQGIVEKSAPLMDFVVPIVVLAVAGFGLGILAGQVAAAVGYRMEYDLRLRLYTAVQRADPQQLDSLAGGQLVTRAMTDLMLMQRILQYAPILLPLIPILLGLPIFLFVLHPVMGFLALASLPANIWLLRRFKDRLWGLSWAELNERSEIATAVDEPVRGIRVVKAFGREEFERSRLASVALKTYRFALSRWFLLARFDVPMKLGPIVTQSLVLLVGALLVAGGSLSLGVFLLSFQVVSAMTQMANTLDEVASAWQYLRTSQLRLSQIIDLGTAPPHANATLNAPGDGLRIEGAAVIRDEQRVIDDVDLDVAHGQIAVVVGAPGSGKSTLAAIISGAAAPDAGTVTIDSVSPRDLNASALPQAVRVVAEEPFLFATTLRDNLQLAAGDEATEDELRRALWAAAAEDVLESLPNGLDGQLGHRGLTLSGGQRQRVALARALVKPPRVLVLDDALSSVNPSLEAEILRRLREVAPDTAIVFLTRRASAAPPGDHLIELPAPTPRASFEAPLPSADGELNFGATTALQQVIDDLHLTTESPPVSEQDIDVDRPATLRTTIRPFRSAVLLAFAALALETVGRYSPELMFGNIANVVETAGTSGIATRAVALIALGAIATGGSYFYRIFSQRFTQGVMYFLRRRMFQRLSKLGIDYYDRESPGQVATRLVNDLDVLAQFMYSTAFRGAAQLGRIVVGMTLVGIIAPGTIPLLLSFAALLLVVGFGQYPVTERAFGTARDRLALVMTNLEEDFLARHEIRGLGAGARQRDRFVESGMQLRRARRRAVLFANVFNNSTSTLARILAALVLLRAGDLVLAGALTVGAALTVRLVIVEAMEPFRSLGQMYAEVANVRVSWKRLKQPYAEDLHPAPNPAAIPCPKLEGDVRFDDVDLIYPHTERSVLHGVSFHLAPRTVTALVGRTGAGKSSIAKLLTRTYDPPRGAVLVDGIDVRDLDHLSYRHRVGVVPQDAFLFRGTIASNIAYGRPGATREEIEAAARVVGAHETLAALSDGYDHTVEEEGKNLTAAQRQLVALARAWIVSPDVMVLDEATSCLDADLEQRVLEAIEAVGVTTLMVTHRENVARAAHRVIVLDEGRIVAEGMPAELVDKDDAYARLWLSEVEPAPNGEAGVETVSIMP